MRSFITYAAFVASAYAVTLQDFKPRVSGLPAACQLVYTTPILGCSASDFAGKGCSDNCISGMTSIGPAVILACSSATLPGDDVITAYLQGKAVKNQCPNAPDSTTSTTEQATTSTPTSTSTTDATTTTPQTTDTPTTSSTSSTVAATTTSSKTSSSARATSSLASDSNSSSSSSVGSSSSSTSSSTASSTPGNISGGGSPFDTASNTAASLSGSASAFALFLSALLAGYML